jgi:hypothetical protein
LPIYYSLGRDESYLRKLPRHLASTINQEIQICSDNQRSFHLGCETARVGPGRTGRVPAKTGRVRVGVFELEPDPFLEGLTQF